MRAGKALLLHLFHLSGAHPALMGVGKLGSMYGELTSISHMGSDQDSNLGPCIHQARTLTTAPSYYPVDYITEQLYFYSMNSKIQWCDMITGCYRASRHYTKSYSS